MEQGRENREVLRGAGHWGGGEVWMPSLNEVQTLQAEGCHQLTWC